MRVTLVAESFYPAVDAATGTVRRVADRMVDDGHTVQIIAPGPGLASYRGARVERVRHRDRPGAQVRERLSAFAPDLVQVHSPGVLGRKALKHARRGGVPTVAAQLAPMAEVSWTWWRGKVADHADRVLVSAGWMRDELLSHGVEAHRWTPGVDVLGFGPQLRDPRLHDHWARASSRGGARVVVGYVGGLQRRHGVRALVELAGVPGVRPVVVGDGAQREWLAARLPHAHLTGALSGADLATALASLDVLVHPGERETCCHVLRESAASGVPVVAPRAGGAPDVVVDGRTGVLYDPARPGAMTAAVAGLVRATQGDRLAAMGARARAHAVRRPWSDALDELVGDHHRAVLPARLARGAA